MVKSKYNSLAYLNSYLAAMNNKKILKRVNQHMYNFVTAISYLFILHKLRVSEKKMSHSTTTSGGKSKIVRKRVTRMVAVLVVCFLVCWFPYSVLDIIRMKGKMI